MESTLLPPIHRVKQRFLRQPLALSPSSCYNPSMDYFVTEIEGGVVTDYHTNAQVDTILVDWDDIGDDCVYAWDMRKRLRAILEQSPVTAADLNKMIERIVSECYYWINGVYRESSHPDDAYSRGRHDALCELLDDLQSLDERDKVEA